MALPIRKRKTKNIKNYGKLAGDVMFDLWRYGRVPKDFETEINKNDSVSLANIKKYLGDNADVAYKNILVNGEANLSMPLVYIEGLINTDLFDNAILKPMRRESAIRTSATESEFLENTANGGVYHVNAEIMNDLSKVIDEIFNGSAVMISDEEKKAVVFDIKGFQMRSMSEPSNEAVIKGAKESFIEVLRANTANVRRRIRSIDLKIESMSVGKTSKIPVAIVYMGSITDKELLSAIKRKIEKMDCENLINIGEFEERLLDKKVSLTVFPQIIVTERPDKFCSNIMEGKIGVLIDGLPTAVILPAVLNMYFHSSDDYSNNYSIASFVRVLRYLCTVIALVLPAAYVAIVCYHQELLNNAMALSMIKGKLEVPLSSLQEVLFLTLAFEVLLEAGIRLPKTIGQTVPIIGGLIIGDAAVSAKILSPVVVIVAAITGIAGFMIPNQDFLNSIRLCRYAFIVCAALAGFFGLAVASVGFVYYLCSIESFGVPYFAPFAANEGKSMLTDTLYRPQMMFKHK